MKRFFLLATALLFFIPAIMAQVTDSYRPGGFDYNGASIKTFSVSDLTAVQFSRGNLQYNPTLNKWRFALRQYQFACNDNANIAEGYDGWIDHFGWGTSGWNSGANAYQPWSTSTTITDYQPGGSIDNDLAGAYAKADWGIYNKIENGGKFAGMWRTLTKDEWSYLLGNNTKRSGKWGLATIAGTFYGLMILPDEWTLPAGCSFTSGNANGYNTNRYSYAEWEKMQAAGAVYLPASGNRYGTEIWDIDTQEGDYWSSSHCDEHDAYNIRFGNDYVRVANNERVHGRSVRLVRRVQTPMVKHDWVDLGLPSGTLWYSCNVGTSSPEGYGRYFAWGETRTKDDYSWENYAYGTSSTTLTKYCDKTNYGLDGFMDNIAVLETADDAARAAQGSAAHTPTEAEWQELASNCKGEETTYNGVKGWMFTSKTNGNRLFLPAGGLRGDSQFENHIYGFYWSSSLSKTIPSRAICYTFGAEADFDSNLRRDGLSIRAVKNGTPAAFDANGASTKTFTVAEGRTVHFSKGNLQYNAATNIWRFALNQYDYVGDVNSNISSSYNGWIDLFCWGTSGWNSGASAYQPWSTSTSNGSYYVGGSYTNNLTGEYANADWGVYNAIQNGGNQTGMWRTLTRNEWIYLLFTRSASTVCGTENARYAKAKIGNVAGLIVLPDNFTMPAGVNDLVSINTSGSAYANNVYTTAQWMVLERAGAIFLPAAGSREGTSVSSAGESGLYCPSTYYSSGATQGIAFTANLVDFSILYRYLGTSVRLVRD